MCIVYITMDYTESSTGVTESRSFITKYPVIKEYIFSSADISPLICKLCTLVLYLRTLLGFTVLDTEPFYSQIIRIDSNIFQHIGNDELKKILRYVITVACMIIDSEDEIIGEDKNKIIDRLILYNNDTQVTPSD